MILLGEHAQIRRHEVSASFGIACRREEMSAVYVEVAPNCGTAQFRRMDGCSGEDTQCIQLIAILEPPEPDSKISSDSIESAGSSGEVLPDGGARLCKSILCVHMLK
jgi:hypothetical protein